VATGDDAQTGGIAPVKAEPLADPPAVDAPPPAGDAIAVLCRIAAETLGATAVWIGPGGDGRLVGGYGPVSLTTAEALADRLTVGGDAVQIGGEAVAEGLVVGVPVALAGGGGVVLGARLAAGGSPPDDAAASLARIAPLVVALLDRPPGHEAAGTEAGGGNRALLADPAEPLPDIGSFVQDGEGNGVEWSDEMFNILDWPHGPPPSTAALLAAFTEDGQAKLAPAIEAALATGKPFDLEAPLVTGGGRLKVVRLMVEAATTEGGERRLVGIARDVTERRQFETRNWRLANHDFLTRLPNRRLFEETLERAIELGRIDGSKIGLLLVDLDYFKEVNASLGHETGDVLLHVIAGRLRRAVRAGDEVARTGGDEFAVLVHDPEGAASLAARSRKILKAVERPVQIRDREVSVRASIGGALYPDHARSVGELLDSAHAALARAKTTGRRIALVYDGEMRQESTSRFRIHESIRGALARDEIFPYYQPKVHLETGRVLGLEALVRWRPGPSELVFPGEFGSALADGFLGSAIATRVLEKVTDDIRDWLDAGLPFGSVAVNVTAIELMRGAYHEQVAEVLQRKGVPFDRFQVEVTETVFLQFEGREIRDTIRKLDALGVKVALDDFGTGFGSLVHLRRLAVSQIKVDRSFIEHIDSQPEDVAIVRALIALGKDLDKSVIAEGIEREEERQTLLALGCVEGQGYLYGLPLPKVETTRMLEAERRRWS